MKKSLLALTISAAMFAVGCAAPQSSPAPAAKAPAPATPVAKWTCTAPGLVTANYTGGATAYVHLSGFTSGGNYPAVKDASGKKATGKTANGTAFTCVSA